MLYGIVAEYPRREHESRFGHYEQMLVQRSLCGREHGAVEPAQRQLGAEQRRQEYQRTEDRVEQQYGYDRIIPKRAFFCRVVEAEQHCRCECQR